MRAKPIHGTIRQYQIIEKIGEGGLGEVYLAQDSILGRRVALKFLTLATDQAERQQILDEARAAASIDHPYACKVFEAAESDGRCFIAMEFLEGETLKQKLKSGPLGVKDALRLVAEMSEALAEAHEKHLVHCDLKPANVMITRSGHVKIMDFGLAKRASRPISNDHTIVMKPVIPGLIGGTPGYMPPEQASGEDLDARADVFSLGVLLFEMLSGTNPFRRETPETTLAAVSNEDPPPIATLVPSVPPALMPILARAMSKDPAHRYQSAGEIWPELARILNGNVTGSEAKLSETPAIAILPFNDLSPERDQEYFCDGLAEELTIALGNVDGLRVTSRTAVMRYKRADIDLRELGRALNVAAILEGSIRKAADRLRITIKLVELDSGCPVWTERYDRRLDDVFQIQEEIAQSVAKKFRVEPGQNDSVAPAIQMIPVICSDRPQNVQAYELYLKGRYFWNRRTEENLRLGIRQFEQALELDPAYILARSGIADSLVTLGLYGAASPMEVMPKAREAAGLALALNPESPAALISHACVRAVFNWDWAGAAEEFERAIRLDPRNTLARQWYAMNCLVPLGQFDQAKEQLRKGQEIDPLLPALSASAGLVHFFEGQYGQAISILRGLSVVEPGFAVAHYFLGQVYLAVARNDEAVAELQRAVELSGRSSETLAMLAVAHAAAGERMKAIDLLHELWRRGRERYVSPVLVAQIQIALQNNDFALVELEQAFRLRATDLIWLKVRPTFAGTRSHPHIADFLSRIFP